MAKRFTDTDKYKKPFFRSLQGPYKLLWDYLYHSCDNAGIWIKDFEIAQIYIGSDMPISEVEALKIFGDRVTVFDGGAKWFIPSFIEFQYGPLNPENRAHNSVILALAKNGLNKPHKSPLRGAMDKDKDKDMDKDIGEDLKVFSHFHQKYPGKKRGAHTEFQNFIKKHKDWKDVLPTLFGIICNQIAAEPNKEKQYWKHLQTYINNRSWEENVSQQVEPGKLPMAL